MHRRHLDASDELGLITFQPRRRSCNPRRKNTHQEKCDYTIMLVYPVLGRQLVTFIVIFMDQQQKSRLSG